MELKEDELQQSTIQTTVTKRTAEVPPTTEIVHKEQQRVPIKKVVADLHPELTAREATVEAEMDQTEAEDHQNLQHAEGGFLKKSNA